MLTESGIFFAVSVFVFCLSHQLTSGSQLLSVLGIGFAQGLYALDAADGATDGPGVVRAISPNHPTNQLTLLCQTVHVLIQALLR
jgi:hypothetical protein